jgi:hypothetical protein
MRLGFVYKNEQINAFYRAYLPMVTMHERGHQVVEVLQERGRPLPVEQLVECDHVHIHRLLLTDDADDCLARLHAAGVAVGIDDDDDVGAAPPELEPLLIDSSLERAKRDFERLLAQASVMDLFTTPSESIADRFEGAGAQNVQVIDNYLPGAFSRVEPQGHDGIVIGWHAAAEHQLDVDALGIDRALLHILEAHEDVHVVTLGIELGLGHPRCRREDFVPIMRLTQRLADFDIGIVPIANTGFNRGRSNVKAREYAAAGVPWLASSVGSYVRLGEDEGGRLVEDGEWFDALDELILARRARAKQAKRAKAWAKRETIWEMAGVWEQAFADAIADMRAVA